MVHINFFVIDDEAVTHRQGTTLNQNADQWWWVGDLF